MTQLFKKLPLIVIGISFIFFLAYSTLILVKHSHFGTGYDLAIQDQAIWQYSQFKNPITTVQAYVFTSILTDHVEIIYILIAPFYWIWNDPRMVLLLQAFIVCISVIPIYLLCQRKSLNILVTYSLCISYLLFYGIQNALWSDVHSLVFAAGFLAWFLYCLDAQKNKWAFLFFFLAISCKEDIALLTGAISFVFFIVDIGTRLLRRSTSRNDKNIVQLINSERTRMALLFMVLSGVYLILVFFVYFPHFTELGYRYAGSGGIFGDAKVQYLYDSSEKQQVYLYSLGSFGFLPLLAPFYLIPAFADVAHYFVFGHAVVSSAQGLFLHYRITLALLLLWPTIMTILRFKFLNNKFIALYILGCALFFQYFLHSPLSYLSKAWFWQEPNSVGSINTILKQIPKDASVVAQSNILPHITHRDFVFVLYPQVRGDIQQLECGKKECQWFRWAGNPKYLIVDTANDWDIRHFLANREDFIEGIKNMEKMGAIKKYKENGTTVLYTINPDRTSN